MQIDCRQGTANSSKVIKHNFHIAVLCNLCRVLLEENVFLIKEQCWLWAIGIIEKAIEIFCAETRRELIALYFVDRKPAKFVQEGKRPIKMFDDHLSTAERAEFLQRVIFEYETLEKRRNKIKRGECYVEIFFFQKGACKWSMRSLNYVWTEVNLQGMCRG